MSGFSAFPGLYYVFGICCIDFVSGSSPERGERRSGGQSCYLQNCAENPRTTSRESWMCSLNWQTVQ